MINRDDLLELTRRMTPARNCFTRIAGSYMDPEGYSDGTFNVNFRKLSAQETNEKLSIAKAVLFSGTNDLLKEYRYTAKDYGPGSMRQLLLGLNQCELKNDAMLEVLYEVFGESFPSRDAYGIFLFHGSYDIPRKGKDKEWLQDSEEIYSFLIAAICKVHGDYESDEPCCGFLYPAFKNRSTDQDHIAVYHKEGFEEKKLLRILAK